MFIQKLKFPIVDYSHIPQMLQENFGIEDTKELELLSNQYIKAYEDCVEIFNKETEIVTDGIELTLNSVRFKDKIKYFVKQLVIKNINKQNNITNDLRNLQEFLAEGNINISNYIYEIEEGIRETKEQKKHNTLYNDVDLLVTIKLENKNYGIDIFANCINMIINNINVGVMPDADNIQNDIINKFFPSFILSIKNFYNQIQKIKNINIDTLNKFNKLIKDGAYNKDYDDTNLNIYRENIVGLLNKSNILPTQINKIINHLDFDVLNTFVKDYIDNNPENIDYNVLFRLIDYISLGSVRTEKIFGKDIAEISNIDIFVNKIADLGDPNIDYNEFKDHELLKNYCTLLKETQSTHLPPGVRKMGGFREYYKNINQTFNSLLTGDWSNIKAGYFVDSRSSISGFLSTDYFKNRFDEELNTSNNVLLFGHYDEKMIGDYYTRGARKFKNIPYDSYEYLKNPYYFPEDIIYLISFLSEVDEEEISKYIIVCCRNEELISKFYSIFISLKKLFFNVREDMIERYQKTFPNIKIALDHIFRLNDKLILEKVIEKLMYVNVPNNKKLNSRLKNILKNYLMELHPYDREHIGVNNFLEQYQDQMNDPEFVALLGSDEASTMPLTRLKKLLNCRENAKKIFGKNYQNTLKFLNDFYLKYGFEAFYNKEDIQKALDEKKLTNENVEIIKLIYYCGIDEEDEDYPEIDDAIDFFEQTNNSEVLKNNQQTIPNDLFNIDKYTFEITNKNDPISFVLGNITSCCQAINGEAEDCLIDGLTNPNAGFLAVYETQKGKFKGLVFQSYWWISKDRSERKTLVLDNIEGRGHCNQEKMKENYISWANYMKQKYSFDKVVMGVGYSDFKIGKQLTESNKNLLLDNRILKENQTGEIYTDLTPGVNLIAKKIIEKLIKLSNNYKKPTY